MVNKTGLVNGIQQYNDDCWEDPPAKSVVVLTADIKFV